MSDAITESSERQDWRTPAEVLDPVRRFFGGVIGLDPCGGEGSIVGAAQEYTGIDGNGLDGLIEPWSENGPAFVNPPYGREIGAWAEKCRREAAFGVEIVLLVPARTGTEWWRRSILPSDAICFWNGRIKFRHPEGARAVGATFDSALVYYGPHAAEFCRAFGPYGWCVRTGGAA